MSDGLLSDMAETILSSMKANLRRLAAERASQGCWSCRYFKNEGPAGEEKRVAGKCRRRAPTISPFPAPGFPMVYATDWCGDHKLDEAKA